MASRFSTKQFCSAIFLSFVTLSSCQNACIPANAIAYEQAVSIRTSISSNTTFYPIPEVPITVSNAPTLIDGITTLQWTSRLARSSPVLSSAVPSATNEAFVLLATSPDPLGKRQATYDYITANGTTTSDCRQAIQHSIQNGVLIATVNGQTLYYSATPGDAYAQFVPSANPSTIVSTFTLQSNQNRLILQWGNQAFYNGYAYFCTLQNGTVYAVFQYNAQPDGCFFFHLTLYSSSTCQQTPSLITGPTDMYPNLSQEQ